MNILQWALLVAGGILVILYILRVNDMQIGVHRFCYVGLHAGLGIACATGAVAVLWEQTSLVNYGAIVLAAGCYLAVTHRPGRKFEPPSYMRIKR